MASNHPVRNTRPTSENETVVYRLPSQPDCLVSGESPSSGPPLRRLACAEASPAADYILGDVIGQGGMGRVYTARQISLDRTVAVKIMRDELVSDPEARALFFAEALVSAELDHPNTVPVYDIGTTESGAPFYAMKVVVGQRWSTCLCQNSIAHNLEILLKVCDAVVFAHDRGVIHRDLKPDNVMIGPYGEVLLMDWGLAGSVGNPRARPLTAESAVCGTPTYMAPEVAGGVLEKIGRASDLYLLAGILYEIVTGSPPHSGAGVRACIDSAARNDLQPTALTGELLEIALCGLRSEPGERYETVREFQTLVREYLAHAESVTLADQGRKRFEGLIEADREDIYRECNEIIALFKQALVSWPRNRRAGEGLVRVRQVLAGIALRRGEIQLARSHGRAMESECRDYDIPLPPTDAIAEQVKEAVAEHDRKSRQHSGYRPD